jgi:hypothetical protein
MAVATKSRKPVTAQQTAKADKAIETHLASIIKTGTLTEVKFAADWFVKRARERAAK